MLAEAGYRMAIYDLFYATDTAVFNQQYDFITATEVLEHLRQPQQEWDRWLELLRPGGVLGVMTKLVYGRSDFATWHDKNDPTHICFYSTDTFNWAAQHWGLTIVFAEKDVIIFRK
jgi:2-polyprenyl-3-methyl-5-hydroxy-6-metoxy-1,4-benzoquinol methylase